MRTAKNAGRYKGQAAVWLEGHISLQQQRASYLLRTEQEGGEFGGPEMYQDVRPAADGVDWGRLPGLESVSAVEVMEGFPEVEDYTILDFELCGIE